MNAGRLRVIRGGALDVFGQMALDEALSEGAEGAWARIYEWTGEGATFGYGQRWREVEREIPERLKGWATRRRTGGGVVLHDTDVTFSAGFGVEGTWRPAEVYRRLHGAILDALRRAGMGGVQAFAGQTDRRGGGVGGGRTGGRGAMVCFRDPVEMDLLDGAGRKILGGAMRRTGGRVLYQGSLRTGGGRGDAGWAGEAVLRGLESALGTRGRETVDWRGEADGARYRERGWVEMR